MAVKGTVLNLRKLARTAADDLKSMVKELNGEPGRDANAKSPRWLRRFNASGKSNNAPKIRGT